MWEIWGVNVPGSVSTDLPHKCWIEWAQFSCMDPSYFIQYRQQVPLTPQDWIPFHSSFWVLGKDNYSAWPFSSLLMLKSYIPVLPVLTPLILHLAFDVIFGFLRIQLQFILCWSSFEHIQLVSREFGRTPAGLVDVDLVGKSWHHCFFLGFSGQPCWEKDAKTSLWLIHECEQS